MRARSVGMKYTVKTVEAELPPGFRFHPTDEELVCDYLMNKNSPLHHPLFLTDIDLNLSEPWDLPESAHVGGNEWYFYSRRDRKYATGSRTNRATFSGYWKATGKDRPVTRRGGLVGMRKTLVFYKGRAPKGKKSNWVMHEFRVISDPEEDWVLCRVFHKKKDVNDNGVDGKQLEEMGGGYNDLWYEEMSSASSSTNNYLPPLMDHFPLPPPTFDYHQNHEQVPCLSSFPTSTNSEVVTASEYDDDEDKLLLDSILNHFTKMDDHHLIKDSAAFSLGEGTSDDRYQMLIK